MASKFNARKNFGDVEYSRVSTSPSKLDLPSKVPAFGELTVKNGSAPIYPKELNAVRLLLVVHIVLNYAYQVFGGVVFKSSLVERLAQWGAVQYSALFCLEGFVLALKYGRNAAKSREQEVFIDTSYFFKLQALEVYPVYLIATVAYFTLESLMTGITNWTQMLLTLTTVDAWLPSSTSLMSRDPTWAVGALLFFYLIFPAIVRLTSQAGRNTLVQMLFYTWLFSSVPALGFVGFDVELGSVPQVVTLTTTSPGTQAASFVFGILLGMLYLKTDRESIPASFAGIMASLSFMMLLIFFATTELFDGRHLVWAYTGMFLPMMGFFYFFVAIGKDALLCSVFRLRAVSESIGSIAMTAFILQRVLVGVSGQMVQSEPGMFWATFWGMLFVAAFFLNRFYSFIYVQQVLPWLSTQGSIHETVEIAERSENPLQGWIWGDNFFAKAARLLLYYAGLALTVAFYMVLALRFDWKGFASVHDIPALNLLVNFLKFCAMISLPSLVFSLIGHVIFPPVLRVRMPSLDYLKKNFKHKVYFRIVTRGKHPNLVRANVQHAAAVLRSVLPFSQYVLEVATDNPLGLETACPGMATELLVPKEYAPTGGAKFKARALQYAIDASSAEPGDWIVHLDEETRFDGETVRGILYHCLQEDEEIAKGRRQFGNIGQGVILYGTKEPDNWLTTLADSVRVGDDFGKFRIQYELHEPLIGMHGSFVVCQNAVERMVTFDHGMEGSITEDAYFALVAQVRGIKFSWIDSFMYEQSPFSCNDFMHQRCRWFAGLWLIVISKRIPFINRAVLLFFMATWAATPLIWVAMTLCMCVSSSVPHWFRAVVGLISGMSTWGYILGFFFTFKPSQGIVRFLVLFALQLLLQPFFAAMELSGVFLGIVNPPTQGFHIVQKESSTLLKNIQASGEPSGVKKQPVSVELV